MSTSKDFVALTESRVVDIFLSNCSSVGEFVDKISFHYGYENEIGKKNSYRIFSAIMKKHGIKNHCYKYNGGNATSKNNYIPMEQWLNSGAVVTSSKLKKKLFREGIKEKECESCGNAAWMGAEIPLELHHVDGNPNNNSLENLLILCPNCHAQTENYKSKNSKGRWQSG
jgi:5-methylcytosine-specific restriction endonuclease McrA